MTTNASIVGVDEDYLLEKAESLIQKENWQDAVLLLRPQHEGGKLSIKGIKMLAQCHSRNGDYIEAAKTYQELCRWPIT